MELSKILMDLYDKANNGGSGGISAEEQNSVIFMAPTTYNPQTEEFENYVPWKIMVGNSIEEPPFPPLPSDTSDSGWLPNGWDVGDLYGTKASFPYVPIGTEALYAEWAVLS